MPHENVTSFIIINGGETDPMGQIDAQTQLREMLPRERYPNLSQALNAVANGDGKATGNKEFEGMPVWHASAGKPGVSSVTLFYTLDGSVARIFAMGQHLNGQVYEISDLGQPGTAFQENRKISL